MAAIQQRLPDPTHTELLSNTYANRWTNRLDSLVASVQAQPDLSQLRIVFEMLLSDLELFLIVGIDDLLTQAYLRGLGYASDQVNRLSPDYQTGAGWTPSDGDNMEALIADAQKSGYGLATDIYFQVSPIIQNAVANGWSVQQTTEAIRKVVDMGKNRAVAIAHTETIRTFNEATRSRWQSWGIKKYRFYTSLNPRVCRDPKVLSDGTIAEHGCEGLHGTVHPIEDKAHRPPLHPLCCCTILPEIEEKK
jgi:SPP1 gp7 family putative phage head morphogenesis protein